MTLYFIPSLLPKSLLALVKGILQHALQTLLLFPVVYKEAYCTSPQNTFVNPLSEDATASRRFLMPSFLSSLNPPSSQENEALSFPSQKPSLTLYYIPSCPYCQKVLRYLHTIHKTIPLKNIQQLPQAKQELKHIGGKSQVPCLVINGEALYESDDIIDWCTRNSHLLESQRVP